MFHSGLQTLEGGVHHGLKSLLRQSLDPMQFTQSLPLRSWARSFAP